MVFFIAKTAGFCFGVSRAVSCAYKESENKRLYTYGSLIHNSGVITSLEERGVFAIDNLAEVKDELLLIRSHGISKDDYNKIKESNINFIDCTCPDVRKIQKIAEEQTSIGLKLIIAGDAKHPEIVGIDSWASGKSIIINSADEIDRYEFDKSYEYAIVAQTTFIKEIFNEITNKLQKMGLKLKIFNTICSATEKRQSEAVEISKNVDVMLVLGDAKSSNTNKLYKLCKKNCEKTYLLESIHDLVLKNLSADDKIGITAGASTPPDLIKEAINFMNDVDKNTQTFEELLDESLVTLHTGDVVKGTVIQVTNNEISVNLQYKSDGIIPKSEYTDDSGADLTDLVKPGEEIEVYVSRVNDGEGNVLLSKKRLDSQKGWVSIEEAFNTQTPIRGKFIDVIKGGMMASICALRVFVPSSQVSSRYVEDLKRFKGKEFDFKIIEYDRKSRRIVAGRKELAAKEEKEIKEKVFSTIEVGQRVEGIVSRIVDFGAFVDLGGVDGLIHISQMSWGRVKKAQDVVAEGDKVIVTVLDVDKEHSKISLSLKDVTNDPWLTATKKYAVGEIVEGKVVRMASFGAFIELEDGVDGLVHVSQISDKHVPKPEDALRIGDVIKVKVTEVDPENKRISLSKKDADAVNKPDDENAEDIAADSTDAIEDAVSVNSNDSVEDI